MSQVSREKFYSLRQLAKRLRNEGVPISERTLYRLIKRKMITPDYTTVGYKRVGMYYFSEEKVKRIIETIKQNNFVEDELKNKSVEDIIREAYNAFCKKIISLEGKEKIEDLKARNKKIREIKDLNERREAVSNFYAAYPESLKNIKDPKIYSLASIFFSRMLDEI
jgi:hypothetical protein